jgi:hypothetical protein
VSSSLDCWSSCSDVATGLVGGWRIGRTGRLRQPAQTIRRVRQQSPRTAGWGRRPARATAGARHHKHLAAVHVPGARYQRPVSLGQQAPRLERPVKELDRLEPPSKSNRLQLAVTRRAAR